MVVIKEGAFPYLMDKIRPPFQWKGRKEEEAFPYLMDKIRPPFQWKGREGLSVSSGQNKAALMEQKISPLGGRVL